jgi:hypothetical protein
MRPIGSKNIKPAMAHVTLRLSIDALDYYKQFPSYTLKIREVLENYAAEQKAIGQSQER